jgi:hypothetical protein
MRLVGEPHWTGSYNEWLKPTRCYHLDNCGTATTLDLIQAIT